MFFLLYFIIAAIKHAALPALYSAVVLLILRTIAWLAPDSWIDRISFRKQDFFKRMAISLWLASMLFSCTHWGDHGFWDRVRIPLRQDHEITCSDGSYTFLKGAGRKPIRIYRFALADTLVLAEADSGKHIAYNLQTQKQQTFKDAHQYNVYAKTHRLSASMDFTDFFHNYQAYWNGWRSFLMP